MIELFRALRNPRFKSRPAEGEVLIDVVKYGTHFRVNFNFGGTYYTSTTDVFLPSDAPSRISGYEHLTTEEAYQERKKKSVGVPSIPLRESDRIRTEADVQTVIESVVSRANQDRNTPWVVVRQNLTVMDEVVLRKLRRRL